MTTAEYLQTPEAVVPQELVFGEFRVADAPFVPHQRLVGDWFRALDAHVRANGLGEILLSPTDVVLDDPRALVVQPDLLYVSKERSEIVGDQVWGVPDLVVEVLSPNPRIGKLGERLGWFAEYGVGECWLIHQHERRVDVLRFGQGEMASRTSFARNEPVVSAALPAFRGSFDSVTGW